MWTRCVFAVLLTTTVVAARAETLVVFDRPEKFYDVSDASRSSRSTLTLIERELVDLGKRYLPPGDVVRITITDIDLAGRGRFGLSPSNGDLRVIDGRIDAPRIDLRYTETVDGVTGPVRTERLTDPDYLTFGAMDAGRNEPLYYERRLLGRWFQQRFVERREAPQAR